MTERKATLPLPPEQEKTLSLPSDQAVVTKQLRLVCTIAHSISCKRRALKGVVFPDPKDLQKTWLTQIPERICKLVELPDKPILYQRYRCYILNNLDGVATKLKDETKELSALCEDLRAIERVYKNGEKLCRTRRDGAAHVYDNWDAIFKQVRLPSADTDDVNAVIVYGGKPDYLVKTIIDNHDGALVNTIQLTYWQARRLGVSHPGKITSLHH